MSFQVGDKVEAFGLPGVVRAVQDKLTAYPVEVRFSEGKVGIFTLEGKYLDWHVIPSLRLIERPKKKVKRTFYLGIDTTRPGFIPNTLNTSNLYKTVEHLRAESKGCDVITEITLEVDEE